MVEGTHFLIMAEDRELTLELLTATQVADAKLFYSVRKENALLAKLMMDKLKAFLDNDYFATIERQTILMRFLEEHDDWEVIQDLLKHLQKSELKDDYTTIIMEWTYHNNETIKTYELAKYDGSILSMSKTNPPPQFRHVDVNGTENFVQSILQITTQLLEDLGADKEDDDEEG